MMISLRESDERLHQVEAKHLPTVLFHIKNSIRQCRETLHCSVCNFHSDLMMLAAMFANKVVLILEVAIGGFMARCNASHNGFDVESFQDRIDLLRLED